MNSEKRRLAESPYATLFTGNFSGFVASAAAPPIATRRSDPVPGRVFPPGCGPAPFTAHCNDDATAADL